MSQPIPEMSSKEAGRLSRLKEDRHLGTKSPIENGSQVERVTKEFAVKKRRDARRLNEAHLNHNEKEPAIDPIQDAPFVPAFIAAILKDIFDLVILALQAAAGASVVLAPLIAVGVALGGVLTACISLFIGAMLILAGQGGKRKKAKRIVKNIAKRGVVWGSFSIIEAMPALAALPLETVMVLVILLMVINERKKIVRLNIARVIKPKNDNVVNFPVRQKQADTQDGEDYRKAA